MKFLKRNLKFVIAVMMFVAVSLCFGITAYCADDKVSLSINENIVAHYYIDCASRRPEATQIRYTYNENSDVNVENRATSVTKEITSDIFEFSVENAAAQITEKTKIELLDKDNKVVDTLSLSAYDYCKNVIAMDKYERNNLKGFVGRGDELEYLCKAVSTYGYAAIKAFDYPVDEMPEDYSTELGLNDVSYTPSVERTAGEKASFIGASFLCTSSASMRFFLGVDANDTTVYAEPVASIDGESDIDVEKGSTIMNGTKYYFIQVNGITPVDFDKKINVQYAGASINMSVLDYAGGVINNSQTTPNDKTLAKSLIILNGTSVNYFDPEFEIVLPNENYYLYRVGNANDVTVSSLFGGSDKVNSSNVEFTFEKVAGTASAAATMNTTDWTKSTIKFSGEGVIKVNLKYGNEIVKTLNLEVVTATNSTTAQSASSKNIVLLNNVSTKSAISVSGGYTLYGNGFTIDGSGVTPSKTGYVISMNNGTLNGVRVEGPKLAECCYAWSDSNSNYYFHTVVTNNTNYIYNSYISNSRSPLRTESGDTYADNTMFDGGRFSNIDVRSGNLHLNNVTTVNQPRMINGNLRVGYGIVIEEENTTSQITVDGYLKQYNWLGKARDVEYAKGDASTDYVGQLFTGMFNPKNSAIQKSYNGDTYMNAGILALNSTVAKATGNGLSKYKTQSVSLVSKSGWVMTPFESFDENSLADNYTSTKIELAEQIPTIPTFSCAYPTEYKDGMVNLSFNQGSSVEFNPNILTSKKYGSTLATKVTMNGTDYTGKNITFNKAGEYVIDYTITDTFNYDHNAQNTGNRTYTKSLKVKVSELIASINDPEFTFMNASNSNLGSRVETDSSGNQYVMPNVSATETNKIGKKTVNNVTVYYTIIETQYKNNSSDFNYNYPIFDGVNIKNYTDANGTSTTYTKTTNIKALPTGLTWVNDADAFTNGKGYLGYYYDTRYNGLHRRSGAVGSNQSERTSVVQFKFEAGNGQTYYYYIGYHSEAHNKPSGCVAEGSMVTMADGTQKAVEDVKQGDMVMTWNFINGCYEAQPVIVQWNHGTEDWNVLTLKFSDGTEVRTINDHGFFDINENKIVYITTSNVEQYIGDSFAKQDSTVTLVGYDETTENVGCYSILTAYNINCVINGMLTNTPPNINDSLFTYFDMGENMQYDQEKMKADIEKYGLYTYDDFAEYLTPEQFELMNFKYYKVLVGRGFLTYDEIVSAIQLYL